MKENEVKITSEFICSLCGTDNFDYREEVWQKREEPYKVFMECKRCKCPQYFIIPALINITNLKTK